MIIGNLYRHPHYKFDNFETKLNNSISLLQSNNKKFILGGDINIDLLNNTSCISNYQQNLISLGCSQKIEVATRFSNNFNSHSLLDHIYTNFNKFELDTKVVIHDITDHFPIIVSLKKAKALKYTSKQSLTQDFRNFNSDLFLSDLHNKLNNSLPVVNDTNPNNLDNLWNKFETVFNETVYHHAPLRKMSRKEKRIKSKPWLTKGILISIKNKNKMYKSHIQDKSTKFNFLYEQYKNLLTRVIKLSKKLFLHEEISKAGSDTKKVWKVINNIINYKNPKNSHIDNIIDKNLNIIDDPEKISNLMNENYVSLVDNLIKNNLDLNSENTKFKLNSKDKVTNSFFLQPLSITQVKKYINSLNISKSSRSDLPKIKFLKLSVEIISPIITEIFNKCIAAGFFPTSLKLAEVIPIHKSGPKNNINNYRPISLLSPFSKLFEMHLYNNLKFFFSKNNIIYKHQFGFIENSSTSLAVIDTVNEIISTLELNHTNCSIFLDLAKANLHSQQLHSVTKIGQIWG